jgi:hypothetical protein
MKTPINFPNCPSANDFDRYLDGIGPAEFTQAFDDHLKQCPLCRESIEGYKLANTSPARLKSRKSANKIFFESRHPNKWITWGSIAAGVIILAGLSTLIWHPRQSKIMFSANNIADPEFIPENITNSTSPGKLTNKLTEDYWYVCNQDIFINDQEINPTNIDAIIDNLNPSKPLIIEVGCACDDKLDQLVKKIKNRRNINIYTFSKDARVHPNRS